MISIEDLLNMKTQPRQAVVNDIPGILSQIMAMGQSSGQSQAPQLPQMDTHIPQVQMQPLPEIRQGGGGTVHQLLSQLASSYLGGRLEEHKDKLKQTEIAKYLDALPKTATDAEMASYLQKGPTEDTQKTGNVMQRLLLEQRIRPDTLPTITAPSGVAGHTELQQQYQYNPATKAFDIPIGEPFGAKINPYGEENQAIHRAQFDLSKEASQRAGEGLRIQQQNVDIQNEARKFQQEQALQADYQNNPAIKNHALIYSAFSKVQSSIGPGVKATAANDMGGIFSIMKILDPTSTVREGEYATAQNATGVPDMLMNTYNKVVSGEKLNPEQRKEFYDMAENLTKSAAAQAEAQRKIYEHRALKKGLDVEMVVSPIPGIETISDQKNVPEVPKGAQMGDIVVIDGKRYRVGE